MRLRIANRTRSALIVVLVETGIAMAAIVLAFLVAIVMVQVF